MKTIQKLNQIEKHIEYYKDYKKRLCQFIIHNCTYVNNGKLHQRINLSADQMLRLLKEIQNIERHVFKLEMKNIYKY